MLILIRNWWALALRGVAAVLFGVVAWVWPDLTVTVLVALFGAYALVDGVFAIVAAIRAAERQARWGPLLFEGVLGIVAGIVALVWPDLTELALLYFIAAWAIVTGVFEIVAAVRLRREIRGELFLGLAGVASVLFGLLLIAFPGDGAVALVWLIGSYAVIVGILLLVLAFRLRGLQQDGSAPTVP